MENFILLNAGWLILAVIGILLAILAISQLKKIEITENVAKTNSVNFLTDSIASTPVMANNPHADIFRQAAQAAIKDGINPWVYLGDNWRTEYLPSRYQGNSVTVEKALVTFITKDADQQIPDSSSVSLSIRKYSDPNSVVMEYRDPGNDSTMVATGHDPEPALYATFANKKGESKTYKLICANGLVRELGKNNTKNFNQDYILKEGDCVIGVTGMSVLQAYGFALKNKLPVECTVAERVISKTPEVTRKRVFADYRKNPGSKFNVVVQPKNILRKEDGKWLYITTKIRTRTSPNPLF